MEELKQLAVQLRCPEGEHGAMVGDSMNETNMGMTLASIDALSLCDGDKVLEVGYGNAGHVSALMARANDLRYHGIDISKTMYEEAMRTNQEMVQAGRAQFDLYDGGVFPCQDKALQSTVTIRFGL